MNSKEMLAKAVQYREIAERLERDAAKALETEKQKESKMAEVEVAREDLIDAVIDYYDTLGVITDKSDETLNEIINSLEESLKEIENVILNIQPKIVKPNSTMSDTEWIRAFINSLK